MSTFLASIATVGAFVVSTFAFNNAATDNIAMYWGQDSVGADKSYNGVQQLNLASYCQDSVLDAIPLAFLDVYFSRGGLPQINFANTCSEQGNGVFPGTSLANCQFMASDIESCQAAGKIVTLSIGGATSKSVFASNSQAEDFGQTIWDLFLGGSSSTRPFGDAVLDGIDLDIESGGSTGYAAFITKIRDLADGDDKQYFITGAPQCPFPDADLGNVMNAVSFDAIYVQFYNNYCQLTTFGNPDDWNFEAWDNWAKTTSPNPDIKIYIGAPASPSAAGTGYVDPAKLASIALATRERYSSFGGVMFWDASQAWANGRPDAIVKAALIGSDSPTSSDSIPSITQTRTRTPATSVTTSTAAMTTTVTPTNCDSVEKWRHHMAYDGGSQVTFNGHLWTNLWWSFDDRPGGVWVDQGSCIIDSSSTFTSAAAPTTIGEKKRTIRYSGGF